MADAKISIQTEAKNEGLEKLQHALAEGQQSVVAMTKELRDLEKATKSGTQATKEQAEAMIGLRQAINAQKAENSAYSKEIGKTVGEIKASVKSMADADKGARGLASAFKLTEGFTTAFSVAIGSLASNIVTGAVSAMTEFAGQVATLGAQMQQNVAHLAAMTGSIQLATEAQRVLNDVYRNTNFQEGAVMNMGEQLMRMGYSAQNAAGLIQLCADAAAGLGTGQQGAQQLVDAISRMQAVGELTNKQMQQLAMAGVNMDAAFKSLDLTGKEAMEAVKDGTLDSQKAIGALTDYLHQYDGKMAESKNNTIDAWGDVTGNLSTMCAEIGNSIFDAFNQSEIVQELIGFTQSLVDMVRSDAPGAFTDLKAIAGEVLDFIGGLLGFVLDAIKLIIVILHDAYAAFKSFGAKVVDAIRPAVDAVMALYDAVKAVMSSIGKNFGAEVGRSWSATFGSNLEPEERAERQRARAANNFQQRSYGGGGGRSGGGGGGGSAKAQLSEEEKAIEAVIKKYADAEKQKWNLAKATLELAKVNMSMLVGDEKAAEAQRIKLEALKDAHDKLIEGYEHELELATKIKDADTRDKTVKSIQDQIQAENDLYAARTKAVLFEDSFKDLQEQSKSIIDMAFGDPEDVRPKIEKIKENLVAAMQEVDAAVANPDPEAQVNNLAKLLQITPEALQEELAVKGQSITDFAEQYKTALANTAAAEAQSITSAQQWHDRLKSYAVDVGKNMGNALTDWITGAKTASEAMKDFVKDLIKNALQLMAQWTGIYLTFLAFGLGNPHAAAQAATKAVFGVDIGRGGSTGGISTGSISVGSYAGHATGGYISGPGTGTSDSIPAMLSNGEYVLRSSAVDRIGVGTLNAMNAGAVPHFAEGGSVDDTAATGIGGGGNVILQVSAIDASSFADFLDRDGLDKIKQALHEDNRRFAFGAGVW